MEDTNIIDPKDFEIRLSFHNYKLLKKEQFVLKGSHIYFVQGPNDTGKTSVLNALKAAHEIKDDTYQKVTRGETEGVNEFSIPGPDGKMYNISYEFTDSSTKFVIFDPSGKKISKVTDMRDIFKYNDVDADKFISWSKTTEGRRKQKELILNLLPAQDYIDFKEYEENEGFVFDARTVEKKKEELAIQLRKEYELTPEEIVKIGKLDAAKKLLSEKEAELVTYAKSEEVRSDLFLKKINLDAQKATMITNYSDKCVQINFSTSSANARILEYERQIKDLQNLIVKENTFNKELAAKLVVIESEHVTGITGIDASIQLLDKQLKDIPEVSDKLEYNNKVIALNATIDKGKAFINDISVLIQKNENFKKHDAALAEISQQVIAYTNEINDLRECKSRIITSGKFPVENLSFDEEGYLTIDGFRFDEHQTCESDTILIVAQLLCKMNISPIQILGDASLLDYTRLDKLYDIAEENGKIMFLDEIDRELDRIVIVGYEKHDKTTVKTKKPSKTTTNKTDFDNL